MKRFYKTVSVTDSGDSFAVRLDERQILTPARTPLVVPTAQLARAIAAEWDSQGDVVDATTMGLTRLANGALDRVTTARAEVLDQILGYIDTDLVCYRAERPVDLAAAQAAAWDPFVTWAERCFVIRLHLTRALLPLTQPASVHRALRAAVQAREAMALAGLAAAALASGSLIIGLTVAAGEVDADRVWQAMRVDETWQASQWGRDGEAARHDEALRREVTDAVRFLGLLRQSAG